MALVGAISNLTGTGAASTGSFGRVEVVSSIDGSVTSSLSVGRVEVKALTIDTTTYTAVTSGTDGPTGPQGHTGPTGAQGSQGSVGDTGAAGAQGAQGASPGGPTGPQGATGAQGSQGGSPGGPTGATGATGAQGSQGGTGGGGPTGPQGAQGGQGGSPGGPTGATGATGAQGSQGGQGGGGGGGPTGAAGIFPSTGGTYTIRKLRVVNPPMPAYNPFADPFVGRYYDGSGTNYIFRNASQSTPAVGYWGGGGTGGNAIAYWGNTYGTLLFRMNANGTSSHLNTSDRKSKANIIPYSGSANVSSSHVNTATAPATETVVSMSQHLKEFRYIQNEPTSSYLAKGYIAQEIEASGSVDMKDFIHSSRGDKSTHSFEDFYSLDYNGVSVVTTKALADIDARLTILESDVTTLEG